MSAIYGYIDWSGRQADPEILDAMSSEISAYPFDCHRQLLLKNVAMGFFSTFTTAESRSEHLPYFDKDAQLYLVADAILDNRKDLISQLHLSADVNDSLLLLAAFKNWREDCTKHLLGDFAFVVYDEQKRHLYLFRDHMGTRLLYYTRKNSCVYFSTLMNPLVKPFMKQTNSLLEQCCEQYLVEFLALPEIIHEMTPGLTLYKNIYYVQPANYVTVTATTLSTHRYWDPTKIRRATRYQKHHYIEEFQLLLNEAVHCRLRTDGNVGVLLSGGLDSSAIGCIAACQLAKYQKFLNTYTSIPGDKYSEWIHSSRIADESGYVQDILNLYPNMIPHFLNCGDADSIHVIDKLLRSVEQPYKYIDNSYWLDGLISQANKDHCKILLTGIYGNSSISYGPIASLLFEHVLHFRFLRFFSDFNSYCKHNHIHRKEYLILLIKLISASIFRKGDGEFASPLLNPEYTRQYQINEKMKKFGYTTKPLRRFRQPQTLALSPASLHHIAAAMTKLGMANHLIIRDPSCDKRLVEFCLQLPYEYYFYKEKGASRGLVRRSLENIVPDSILNNILKRGIQGADWLERIEDFWDDVIDSLNKDINSPSPNFVFSYINLPYLKNLIEKNKKIIFSFAATKEIRDILMVYILVRFFENP